MGELVTQTKENWLNTVESILNQFNFTKENEDSYKREFSTYTQSKVMIINGHRIEQPGQQIIIKHIIKFDGDGHVSDEDEISNKREFSVITFETYAGDENQGSYSECIYWDDLDRFRTIITQFIQ